MYSSSYSIPATALRGSSPINPATMRNTKQTIRGTILQYGSMTVARNWYWHPEGVHSRVGAQFGKEFVSPPRQPKSAAVQEIKDNLNYLVHAMKILTR